MAPPVTVARAALRCRCPRCGEGPLFDGLLAVRAGCSVCRLDLTKVDTGDGFAVPILIVLGAIVVGAAFWVDVHFAPALWVHALIWPPVTILLVLVMTRYLKSLLAAQQFATRKTEMGL